MSIDFNTKPLVSICCMTYNHANFIRECLDGFVMQKTTFPFEILIHEDASTDNTANILKEYESKYSHLFRCVYQTVNQFTIQNTLTNILFPMAKGKYIALCEGDDYWTDPYKLQKQVDFLESNPDYTLCFHNVLINHEGVKGEDHLFCKEVMDTTDIKNVINNYYIPTLSMVYRCNCISPLPEWFGEIYNGDYALQLLLSHQGKIKYINENMGVYRKQPGGLNATMQNKIVWRHKISLMNYFNIYTNFKYNDLIKKRIDELFEEYGVILKGKQNKFFKLFTVSFWIKRVNKLFNTKR